MRDDNGAGPKGTILGSGLGPWLISDRPKGWEWESFARREPKPARERLGPLHPHRLADATEG
jgi:hypothetical protein